MKEQGVSTDDLGVPTWRRLYGVSRGPLVVVQWTLTVQFAEHLQDHCYTPGVESQHGEGDLMSFFHIA